jgi:hypothetical protein
VFGDAPEFGHRSFELAAKIGFLRLKTWSFLDIAYLPGKTKASMF